MESKVIKILELKKGKETNLFRKHPWIFSGALAENQELPIDGTLVYIHDNKKQRLGFGHYHNGSIAVKILQFGNVDYGEDFWFNRLKTSFELRKSFGFENHLINCYRWVHGEGDQLPGLIIDIFDRQVVIQCHTIGMHKQLAEITEAIKIVFGNSLTCIVDKSKETLPAEYAHSIQNNILFGEYEDQICMEYGFRFSIDSLSGQKTGFFLDQRENRQLLTRYVKDKMILNAYCYSGGFSIYALANGAKTVHSIDVSKKALELLEKNLSLNNLEKPSHETICADVNEYLKNMEPDKYDMIILDPPAFAKSLAKKHNAVQAYKRINTLALKKIKDKGILFSFSCSQVIDEQLFYHTIVSAGIESGKNIKVLHRLSQGPDHPVSLFHPEGSYLKGLVLLVEEE